MVSRTGSATTLAVLWAPLLTCGAGCGREAEGFGRFLPAPAPARTALESALDAWRGGRPPGPIGSGSPRVVVVDSQRPAGRALKGFAIVGEAVDHNARCFTVRVRLDNPDESQLVRFQVFGLDPLWVYRREDYDMISHWEHDMDNAPDPSPAATEVVR